jgi:cystathionine beta-lyase/cystathionine gamma-synthase
MSEQHNLDTRCIHSGELDDPQGSPHTPIYDSTTFAFRNTADLLDVVEGRRPGALYTRYGLNPTLHSLEAKLASLESSEGSLSFCSGMAAEAALFLAHGREGVLCIGDAYGGTLDLIANQLPLLGIPTFFMLGDELDTLDAVLDQRPGLVFFETPTNPTLEVFDIQAIAEQAHRHGALLAVDNTFATPVNQQPLALGADIVVHSATKYLGGHSDLTAGALMATGALLEPIWAWRKNLGQAPAPQTAALLARSIRTLGVRVRQQNASSLLIARAMEAHPRIARVFHPGLESSPGHQLAARQMSGFGGMLSIEIDGTGADASAMVDRLKLFAIAPSLGGVESLVTQPVTTTHHDLVPEDRMRRGISDSLVRLSVGLEDVQDILADLYQAID